MQIAGSIALVTGANRGIGRQYVLELQHRGAAKIYAAARNPERIDIPGVVPIALDITDPESVAAAARIAADVTLLINNAGISTAQNLVTGNLDTIRLEMETHYFGTLNMVRAFAPVLGANGGGAILNMLSALSWRSYDGANAYAAAKAAEWSLTNGIRLELAGQGTLVAGLHVGAVDTDMMAGWEIAKFDPAELARIALDGIEAGKLEIIVDETAAQAKVTLALDPIQAYAGVVVGG